MPQTQENVCSPQSETAFAIWAAAAGIVMVAIMLLVATGGCAGRPSIFANSDADLQKTASQFAADAARRHPFKADAPRGPDATARAEIDYTFRKVKLENLSDDDWKDVEVWINQKYVVFVPNMPRKSLKVLDFPSFYDGEGNYFPIYKGTLLIDKLEILRDGTLYNIPPHLP